MERVGVRIRIEDDYGPRRVGGRLERVEVAEIESLVPERRAEAESGEMVRHFLSSFFSRDFNPGFELGSDLCRIPVGNLSSATKRFRRPTKVATE